MTKYILDIETSVRFDEKGKYKSSPYDTACKLVTVCVKNVETQEVKMLVFNHTEAPVVEKVYLDPVKQLSSILNGATLIIGHNLKFDMSWLYECGFKYDGALYDTMLFEYVAAKGLKPGLSLADCAERYKLDQKKDILKDYLNVGVNTDLIPLAELSEYAIQDIETTYQLYQHQRARYAAEEEIRKMWPAIKLSNETLEVLIDIERNGIKIDIDALNAVEKEYREEKAQLEVKLNDMVRAVMGDTPINLASPNDMTKVVYSLEVIDKKKWAELFNIGQEVVDGVAKKKYVRRYKEEVFRDVIRKNTSKVYRTDAKHCEACDGRGVIQKYKKDKVSKKTGIVTPGEPHKKPTKCKVCNGAKVLYIPNDRIAGFKVRPIDSEYATSSGFSTDKTTIDDLVDTGRLSPDAEVFLRSLQRLNAIDTYLSAFVEGIRNSISSDGFCHPNFNQGVTSTGRLSASGPNWHNQPRGGTFPIRRCVISRHTGGKLMPTDFAALEYRTAVMLARCPAGLDSIIKGKDRHQVSAEVIFGAVKEDMTADEWKEVRQSAKSSTFAPLYGGGNASEKLKKYRDAFFAEHVGIAKWHEELCKEALATKQIVMPSGRHFAFPFVRRNENGNVQGRTKIVNWGVQSFATADLAWCVIIPLWREMKTLGLKSKLILQVHDDVVPDVPPEEVDIMIELLKKHFDNVWTYLTERFNYVTNVPIGYEISIGDNLMDKKTIFERK